MNPLPFPRLHPVALELEIGHNSISTTPFGHPNGLQARFLQDGGRMDQIECGRRRSSALKADPPARIDRRGIGLIALWYRRRERLVAATGRAGWGRGSKQRMMMMMMMVSHGGGGIVPIGFLELQGPRGGRGGWGRSHRSAIGDTKGRER